MLRSYDLGILEPQHANIRDLIAVCSATSTILIYWKLVPGLALTICEA